MEENKLHIKEILKQASTQKAPSDMAERVLSSWKVAQAPVTVVPPLISKRTWVLLTVTFLSIITWLVLNYSGGSAQTEIGGLLEKVDFSIDLSFLSWSPTMMMSIAAFALMIGVNILINKSRNTRDGYLHS